MESMLEKQESDAECGFSDGVSIPLQTSFARYSMLAIVYPAIPFPLSITRLLLPTCLQRHPWSYRHYAYIRTLDVPQRKLVALTLS